MIGDCKEKNVDQCTVSLSLGRVFKVTAQGIVDIEKPENAELAELKLPYVLEPGEYVLGRTIEKIDQKQTKYALFINTQSRAFRMGLGIFCGVGQPTYKGEIVFGIKNLSPYRILLKAGLKLVKVAFIDIKSDIVPMQFYYENGRVI
jgi:deoxycytidine triphosphate deaminase